MLRSSPISQTAMEQLAAEAFAEARRRHLLRTYFRIPFELRGAVKELQERLDGEVVVSGPAGTGKTLGCLLKLWTVANIYAGSRTLVIRKVRSDLSESGLVTLERDIIGTTNPIVLDGPQRAYRHNYVLPNGSIIVVAGLDKPGKILSSEYDLIFSQQAEELTETDWETLTTRLRSDVSPYQQLIADVNPVSPRHWIKVRSDGGRTTMLESRHEDNPKLWDGQNWTPYGAAYIAKLDALTGVRKLRLRYGRWAQAEGVVYDLWDPPIHLIDHFDPPASWRKMRVIDFGFVHPFVCLWFALDEDGRMYLYRQLYMTKRTVRQHAEQIKALSASDETLDPRIVCDHDAEDMATLRENGLDTIPAKKEVRVGIEAVTERLRVQADGRPRLYVMRNSLIEIDQDLKDAGLPWCLEQEMDSYVWASSATKDEPKKENDHGADATRYGVQAIDKAVPKAKVRRLDMGA